MHDDNEFSVTVVAMNRVELVGKLRALADNFDGTPAATDGKVMAKSTAAKTAKPKSAVVEETDEDFAPDTSGEPTGFDGDDEIQETIEEDEIADDPPPKKTAAKGKAAKAKKITLDDVNDACKAHAQAKGRPATLGVLQQKFKTQSVTALKPEQYEACISAMAVN